MRYPAATEKRWRHRHLYMKTPPGRMKAALEAKVRWTHKYLRGRRKT